MSQNLTIHKGEQTHTMPMNTPTHAINAIRNSQTETRVSAIVNATDYQSLIKQLATLTRPFGIAIIQPK
jgi:hypothetical protein